MKFLTGKFWVFFCGGFLLAGVIVALPLFCRSRSKFKAARDGFP